MRKQVITVIFIMFFLAVGIAFAASATLTISSDPAADSFTSALNVSRFNVSVSGTWAGTVTLQRSFDNSGTWVDVDTFSANTETSVLDPEMSIQYRIGMKNGDYTSGTVNLRLSR